MSRICGALLVALAFALPARAADSSPQDLLARMADAMRTLDYQGSFIYQHGGRIDALRVFHAGGTRERERLISLNGAASEVVRDGNTVTCIQPDHAPTVFANGPNGRLVPLVPVARPGALADHYTLALDRRDRVAGYVAQILDVTPRDAFRYGYRLWLENGTGVLLRSQVLDGERHLLEQFMFVALQIGATPSETDLLPSQRDIKAVAPTEEVPIGGQPYWRVADAPPGFVLTASQRPLQGTAKSEHLVYSDGLANVSVYIEPGGEPADRDTTLNRGALNVFTRADGSWRITALGDVPAATVARMARSVAATAGQAP